MSGTVKDREVRFRENQTQFVQNRITSVENQFGQLCTDFGCYTRKIARLRDKGDLIAQHLMNFAYSEDSKQLKSAFSEVAENVSLAQDYRNAEVKRLEVKVIEQLQKYGDKCKKAKASVKTSSDAQQKEMNTQKKLNTIQEQRRTDTTAQISEARSELQKANMNASRQSRALEEMVDRFEQERLYDLKSILTEFLNIEMVAHAKSLEVLTRASHALVDADPEEALQQFRLSLKPPDEATQQLTGSVTSPTNPYGPPPANYGTPRSKQGGPGSSGGGRSRHQSDRSDEPSPRRVTTSSGQRPADRNMYVSDDSEDEDEEDESYYKR